VLIPGSDGTLANPGHVGLYIGDGLVLSATDPEQGVIVQTWANFTAGGLWESGTSDEPVFRMRRTSHETGGADRGHRLSEEQSGPLEPA